MEYTFVDNATTNSTYRGNYKLHGREVWARSGVNLALLAD